MGDFSDEDEPVCEICGGNGWVHLVPGRGWEGCLQPTAGGRCCDWYNRPCSCVTKSPLPKGVPLRERFADQAHTSWAGWMRYLFSKSVRNGDGSVTIPASLVARWERQMKTPYLRLSETEKQSDRQEADFYLALLRLQGHENG